ncbi:MAG: site-specific integrase [Proteobacteria bacterium]|nr:site-specific integrase [Pseudomonadota bacterium]
MAWADIVLDGETPMLTVRRSYRGKPKNEASAATVPISSDAAALLRHWRAEQGEPSLWVFPGVHGQIIAHSSYPEACKIHQSAERAGIHTHVTPHVFRHSFGTWVYERTGDPKIVQRLMRHASFQTSMGYVHDSRLLAPFVDKLPSLIRPSNEPSR